MAKTRKVNRGRTRRLRGPRKTQRGRGLFNSFLAKKPNLPTVVVENPAHGINKRANLTRFNAYKTTVNPLRARAAAKSNVSQSPLTNMLKSNVSKNEKVTAPSPVLSNTQPNTSGQLSRNFMRKRLNNGENPNMTHLTRNPLREAVNLSYQIPGRYP